MTDDTIVIAQIATSRSASDIAKQIIISAPGPVERAILVTQILSLLGDRIDTASIKSSL